MKTHIELPSKDALTTLHLVQWTPEKPKAILQLVHGMAEFIERYDEFANYLVAQDFLVIGHDHLGHGQSVSKTEPLYGYFSDSQSANLLIEDTYQVTELIQVQHPDLPLFIMGHSMGSFVLRNYLTRYSTHLAGAIIMGTGGRRSELKFALPLAKALNQQQPKSINHFFDKLAFGGFAKHFPEKKSSFDWLSKNPDNVRTYIAHPKMGFVFTNNGFHTLFTLMSKATEINWFEPIQRELPIYITSGEQDPVGDFGKGPREVANELAEADFKDVTLHLYRDLRHEILNENEKQMVMMDILNWLNRHL
ncbi:alpha/beta hydrolase [uncultured Vagococcus sp.]|uniref:alpha/beta hydrolase n=1 Tax=uncultured Vagococcus sp. TaxID=189676 RepID=UPI0028D38E3D|nr:alpha/beta hydrolase [uncultured Vagococcus sp.]